MHGAILALAKSVLSPNCDRIALNLTQAVEIHPDALAQYPHRDHDLWPAIKSGQQFQINVMWPLSPFTAENGATRLWPGSHRLGYDGDTSESVAVPAGCQPGDEIGRASCRERVWQYV